MKKDDRSDELTAAINDITEKVSKVMLAEYMTLPSDLHIGLVLIKAAQLLLANILCHVAMDSEELNRIAAEQGEEIQDLTRTCAFTGFADKFGVGKH